MAVAAVALAAVAALAVAAALDARVLDRGHLLPWDSGGTRLVETLGVRIYLGSETELDADAIDAWIIVSAAAVCGFALLVGRRVGAPARHLRFLGLIGAGALWLTVDESFGLHETIGHNLGFLADLPAISHPDDVIVAAYLVIGLAVLVRHADLVRRSRAATRWFAATLAVGVTAAAADVSERAPYKVEELLEILTMLTLLAGVACLALELLMLPAAALAASAAPGTPAPRRSSAARRAPERSPAP